MAIMEADHYSSDYDGSIAGELPVQEPSAQKARLPMPRTPGSILSRQPV
jgi:hypothetical protein